MRWAFAVFLVACAGTTGFADEGATYPELTRSNNPASRIVSGWEAQEGQFPYQLSIRMVRNDGAVFSCGGSLIHHEWGLTAAHCTAMRVSFVVRVGTVNLTRPHLIFETTEYYNHPFYIDILPIVQANDIGLLKFNRFVEYNEFVQPIRIQRSSAKDRNFDQVQLTASGWGGLWTGQSGPENLNWVYLRGVTNQLCHASYGNIIQDSTICTVGYNVTSQSTCQGDSGGPLTVVDDDGQVSIVGVTSFVSSQGCHVGLPAGFIRPGHYHLWFTIVTGIDFDWEYVPTTTSPPVTDDISTNYPTTVKPITVEPTTAEPTTAVPTTVEPTTVEPTTVEPTTVEPTTVEPTTVEPTTVEPTTVEPTTVEPTTVEPTTVEPTTVEPTTVEPTTVEPTTVEPTTVEPTTVEPTTVEPTTVEPTTVEPTTAEPTTEEPTTVEPTTVEPITVEPTTEEPTTEEPTTEEPTEQPPTTASSEEDSDSKPSESSESSSSSSESDDTEESSESDETEESSESDETEESS